MITTRRGQWLQRGLAGGLILAGVAQGGCAPSLNPEEYGQVVYELPRVEGADRPYPLPDLAEPAETPSKAPN